MFVRRSLLSLVCWCSAAFGQIDGRFSIEKKTFALGEPVFLDFEVSNSGPEAIEVIRADPYAFCAGYVIHLSTDPSPTSSCSSILRGGSCAYSSRTLQPGAKYNERILVNYDHEVGAPGDYVVEANRHLKYGPSPGRLESTLESTLDFHDRLHFFVEGTPGTPLKVATPM